VLLRRPSSQRAAKLKHTRGPKTGGEPLGSLHGRSKKIVCVGWLATTPAPAPPPPPAAAHPGARVSQTRAPGWAAAYCKMFFTESAARGLIDVIDVIDHAWRPIDTPDTPAADYHAAMPACLLAAAARAWRRRRRA
jgi:hypothetical protein